MALEIECRNTFIHLKEECEDMAGSSKVRAHSSPPGQLRPTSFGMETTNVVSRKSDGQTPTTACGSSPTSPMSWDDSPGSQEGPEHAPILAEFFPLLPSQGSLGHPEVCRRPCIYFIAGNCENGRACAYCHIEHTEKTPKLDKRQRTIMQGLGWSQLLAQVLQFCRNRATDAGFLDEAEEVLTLLEQGAVAAPALSIPERELRNLHKTLARMNFSNLVGLVTHAAPTRGAVAMAEGAALSDALEALRVNVALSCQ